MEKGVKSSDIGLLSGFRLHQVLISGTLNLNTIKR